MAPLPPNPSIFTTVSESNGQLIRAEVYFNFQTGSLVLHDQHGQLITFNMQRFPALLVALNQVAGALAQRKDPQ